MAEYTESFARFILECRETYDELCERIENGEVPSGTAATIRVTIPAEAVDEIRLDRLRVMAEANGHG